MGGWGTIYNNTKLALGQHSQRIAALQEQVASGARINRASDDPADAYRILNLRAQSDSLTQYTRNLQEVTRTLELNYSLVSEISTNLRSVAQKLEQAASGTYNDSNRVILGKDIDSVLQQVLALANTKSLGRYAFSGAASDVRPYLTETEGGYITAVRYQGSRTDLPVPIAPGVEMSGVLIGADVFRSDNAGTPEFLGETGAAAGTGTSNVRGSFYLEITHKETTVTADPSGVNLQVGGSSAAGDTVLGVRDLIVDPSGKTVRFADDGPTFSFTGTETDLAVRDADGNVVHLDVSALNGAVVGPVTVTIQSDGYLSLGDGAPVTELTDFTEANLAVTDADGRVLYVDATGIRATGLETVRVPGTADVFETLIFARDALLNDRGLPRAEQLKLVQTSLESLEEVIAQITQSMTSVGGRLEALDTLEGSLRTIRASADDQAGALENADLVQLAADLARMQTLYEMTLATASRLLSTTLLDYL